MESIIKNKGPGINYLSCSMLPNMFWSFISLVIWVITLQFFKLWFKELFKLLLKLEETAFNSFFGP